MSGARPLVSVIMAAHNDERTVAAAVRSVLGQTLRDLEMVVVDDASRDDTPGILRRLAGEDERLVVLSNDRRRERAYSRNLALRHARGDLVAVMDSDDVSLPDRLARQVELMQDRPEVALLGGWSYEVTPGGEPLWLREGPLDNAGIRARLQRPGPLPFVHASVIFRREDALAIDGYLEQTVPAEDVDLFWRLLEHGQAASIPRIVVLKRVDWRKEARFPFRHRAQGLRVRWRWSRRTGGLSPRNRLLFLTSAVRLVLPMPLDIRLRRLKRRLQRPELPREVADWFDHCTRAGVG